MKSFDPGFDVPLSTHEEGVFLGECGVLEGPMNSSPGYFLVTGAGGSLGRPLVLQLLAAGHHVVALDRSEKGLFFLKTLVSEEPELPVPEFVVLDLADVPGLRRVFQGRRISHIVHAAAHKHVGLMELNAEVCYHNNVTCTLQLLDEARRHDVGRFLFLSTDKSVDPTGVMGRTKAEAEKALMEQSSRGGPWLASLRLPNVLGSDGSVIQIFRRQLLLKRPLSLTDPQAERLFVSSQQACCLIRAACAMTEAGVFIPSRSVRLSVLDLADRAHQLWGMEDQYEVVVGGLGPGERLKESLLGADEMAQSTEHPDLLRVVAKKEARDAAF